ncbi:ABC transporter transmembrane domain-containing protein [Micromonospora sp. L32]|uniref:ABC transporter transmembrane domain-containing protein n=1 Tax=Micromonospora sp. L32 TaxID=3452214 RepID=UPI003F8AF9FF
MVTRTTRDVALLSTEVRTAVPDAMTAGTAILVGLGAMLLLDPRVAVPGLVGVPLVWLVARRYLARAGGAYLRESSAYSRITDGLAETVDGARTVEAFGLADRRVRRARRDVAEASAAERYTLRLRTAFLPCLDTATMVPVVLTLLIGGYLHAAGLVGVSTVTTATLYAHQLIQPVNLLLGRLEDLQLGGASMARLLGVRPRRRDGGSAATPPGEEWVIQLRGVRHAYQPGRDVLHGVDLEIRPGETLAVVGPSGAGKSTLGRLIAGLEAPRAGAVTVGGVALTALPPDELRRRVVLVRQESMCSPVRCGRTST